MLERLITASADYPFVMRVVVRKRVASLVGDRQDWVVGSRRVEGLGCLGEDPGLLLGVKVV